MAADQFIIVRFTGPQRRWQINAGGGQFCLEKSADIALVANDQALNALGQIPQRLTFIASGWSDRTSDDKLYPCQWIAPHY